MGNHYETLGVSQDANEKDIKSAYRSLSLKYHPDRNSDPEATSKFQEISAAYEVLSDPSSKKNYDHELKYGQGNPFDSMGGGGGMDEFNDMNQLFNMMFSMGGLGGMGGFTNIHQMRGAGHGGGIPEIRVFRNGPGGFHAEFSSSFHHQSPPPPIKKIVEITLEQCFHGISMPIEYERWTIINGMKVNEIETLNVNIPAGMDEQDTFVIKDKGNIINENLKGDLHIGVKINNTTCFKRQGLDLHFHQKVSLKDALCGFSFNIPHLNGKLLCLNNLNNPTVIKPGYKRIVNNLGLTRERTTGNLIIEFEIEFPDQLTGEQIEKLKEIM
jgi:DnaJ-class molecular chaperone